MVSLVFISSLLRDIEENVLFETGLSGEHSFFCLFEYFHCSLNAFFLIYLFVVTAEFVGPCVGLTK